MRWAWSNQPSSDGKRGPPDPPYTSIEATSARRRSTRDSARGDSPTTRPNSRSRWPCEMPSSSATSAIGRVGAASSAATAARDPLRPGSSGDEVFARARPRRDRAPSSGPAADSESRTAKPGHGGGIHDPAADRSWRDAERGAQPVGVATTPTAQVPPIGSFTIAASSGPIRKPRSARYGSPAPFPRDLQDRVAEHDAEHGRSGRRDPLARRRHRAARVPELRDVRPQLGAGARVRRSRRSCELARRSARRPRGASAPDRRSPPPRSRRGR